MYLILSKIEAQSTSTIYYIYRWCLLEPTKTDYYLNIIEIPCWGVHILLPEINKHPIWHDKNIWSECRLHNLIILINLFGKITHHIQYSKDNYLIFQQPDYSPDIYYYILSPFQYLFSPDTNICLFYFHLNFTVNQVGSRGLTIGLLKLQN